MLQLFKSKEHIRRNTYKIQISSKMNSRNNSRRSNDERSSEDEDNDSRTIMSLIAPAAASALRSNWAHRQSRGNYRNLNQAFGAIQHRTRDDPIQTRRRITDYTGQDQAPDSRRRDPDWPRNEHSISDTWQGSNAWNLEIDRREAIHGPTPVRSIAFPARGFSSARSPPRIGSNQEVVTLSNGEQYPITQTQQESDIQTRYYNQPYEPPPVRLTRIRETAPVMLRNMPFCESCRIFQAESFLARAVCSHKICDICRRHGCKQC